MIKRTASRGDRVPTGIPGFDEQIEGGLPRGSTTLISGAPGTGKSIFAQQFLYTGAQRGEKGLYISLEQRIPEIYTQARRFGWDFATLEKQGKVKFNFFDISQRILGEGQTYPNLIKSEAQRFNPSRLVIDSLVPLANFPISAEELASFGIISDFDKLFPVGIQEDMVIRMQIHKLIMALKDLPCTCVLVSEIAKESKWLSRDRVSEFMCDGVVVLHYLGIGATSNRSLVIEKMRGTKHTEDVLPMEITTKGIVVRSSEEAYKV